MSSVYPVPVMLLTTTGAKTGQPRTLPLLYVTDGDRILLIASNYGKTSHPAWYRNLVANPKVEVLAGKRSGTYNAGEITDPAERERAWDLALDTVRRLWRLRGACGRPDDPAGAVGARGRLSYPQLRDFIHRLGLSWVDGRRAPVGSLVCSINSSRPPQLPPVLGGGGVGAGGERRVCAAAVGDRRRAGARLAEDGSAEREQWCLDNWDAVAAEVAAAHEVSLGVASHQLMLAMALRERLPRVAEVFAAGRVGVRLVNAIVHRTALITDPQARAKVDVSWPRRVGGVGPAVGGQDRDRPSTIGWTDMTRMRCGAWRPARGAMSTGPARTGAARRRSRRCCSTTTPPPWTSAWTRWPARYATVIRAHWISAAPTRWGRWGRRRPAGMRLRLQRLPRGGEAAQRSGVHVVAERENPVGRHPRCSSTAKPRPADHVGAGDDHHRSAGRARRRPVRRTAPAVMFGGAILPLRYWRPKSPPRRRSAW